MYNNSDDCDLVEGWYTVKVNNVPVVVDTANNVVADQHGKPTCFYFSKVPRYGGGCSYNIYVDQAQTKFTEYNNNNWEVYIQQEDQNHLTPRYWTLKLLGPGTYTIGPNPPSVNGWTAPEQGGQLELATLTPTAEQEFVLTPCKPSKY